MSPVISSSQHDGGAINLSRCFDKNENTTKRKRRRPQQDLLDKSTASSSIDDDSPIRQKTQTRTSPRIHHHNAKRKSLSPTILWIALLLVCYRLDQHPCTIFYADAAKLRGEGQRFLQKNSNPGTTTSSHPVAIDYLDLPKILWMRKDPQDQFHEGNGIRVSPYDESILYATSRSGDLRVFSATNGKPLIRVRPSPRTITEEGTTSTWSLYSDSGMTFGTFLQAEESAPEIYTETDDGNGYNDYLEFLLNNGIDHNELQDKEQKPVHFVAYSIVDEAPSDSRFLPKTRVVCVSVPEHKILWTSAGLPGKSNGSPLIYYANDAGLPPSAYDENGKDENGATNAMYIVLTHNSVLVRPDNTTRTTGHLTVLDPLTGHVKWTQSEWSREDIPKGYGPPQVSHNPVLGGKFSGGSLDNKNDVIIWTSSDQQGRGRIGHLFSFQMKSSSEMEIELTAYKKNNTEEDESAQYDPFQTRVLKRVRWNSIARPTLNRNGTNLYIGMTGNSVRGWNGDSGFDAPADWSARLVPFNTGSNASTQTYSEDVVMSAAPVLSADEERLFVVSARNETICLDARDGSRMWTATTSESSPLLGEPKASPDNRRLYMIMSEDGRVNGVDQRTGKVLWNFGCDADFLPEGTECENPPTVADFDLSNDGDILYFGTTDGRIVAITLGHHIEDNKKDEKENPTPPISMDTSKDSSTFTIAYDDDGFDDETSDDRSASKFDNALGSNNDKQNYGGKIAGSLFAIALSVVVATASVMYVMRAKGLDQINWSNYRFPRQRSSSDGGGKRNSFVAAVSRGIFRVDGSNQYPNGPDKYEDRMIASLSDDERSIEQQFNTLWVDPTHSNPKSTVYDAESPTADRLAVMLGTSNRIAPISENFGYGQAVLL